MAESAYVFGYGSLMERASRTRTNPDAIGAWPARVTGFQRGWFHQFSNHVGSSCTYLGAIKTAGTINGVIYYVADIEKTKERETGYTSRLVPPNSIAMLDGGGPWNRAKEVYIFESNPSDISKTKEPTPDLPMVESYCGYLCQWLPGNRSALPLGPGLCSGIY